jgi:primosomal protein N'
MLKPIINARCSVAEARGNERMAESAGRYCPLCGEAAGLLDRFCRRCGESLQGPAPGVQRAIAKLDGEPTDEEVSQRDEDTIRKRQSAEGVGPES